MAALPSEEQHAYMLAHEDDNLVTNIIVCCSICGAAAIVFILLRLYSQYLISSRFRLTRSDCLIILGCVLYETFVISFTLSTVYGAGRHIIYISDPRMLQILNIVDENTYSFSMACIKISILTLYGDIFSSRRFHYCLWTTAAVISAWALSCAFTAIFQCTPIAFNWDRSIEGGYCVKYAISLLVAGIINIITDFVILGLPIPMILRLRISKQKKWLLCFTFAAGGSACIVSIIRLAFTLKVGATADASWEDIPAGLLSAVELMAGILAASIPTYRPLYRRIVYGSINLSTNTDAMPSYGDHPDRKYSKGKSRDLSLDTQLSVGVTAGGFAATSRQGINVTNQIELVRHKNMGGNWVRVPDEVNL